MIHMVLEGAKRGGGAVPQSSFGFLGAQILSLLDS